MSTITEAAGAYRDLVRAYRQLQDEDRRLQEELEKLRHRYESAGKAYYRLLLERDAYRNEARALRHSVIRLQRELAFRAAMNRPAAHA